MNGLYNQGINEIHKAVEYDKKGNSMKRSSSVEEYEKALVYYKNGIKILLQHIQCSYLWKMLMCSWKESLCCKEYSYEMYWVFGSY